MTIPFETIQKIQSIFIHLQLCGKDAVQTYNTFEEFREHYLIGDAPRFDLSRKIVYLHTFNFNRWHQKIWNKRKKEIPFENFITEFDNNGKTIYRIGFTDRIVAGGRGLRSL